MKILSALIFLLMSISPLANASDDLFKGMDDKTMYIYPSIPILEGADLMEFHESYTRSRSEQFGESVNAAERLIGAGATGAEALEMIMAFDSMVTMRRAYSKQRMGVTLEGFFNGRLSDLYRIYSPSVRKLDFKNVEYPASIIKHINQNQRPGYISKEDMKELDFIIYGSYSVSKSPGNIHLSIYVMNTKSGITRVFNAHGSPKFAAYSAAGQLFHEFQKTRFPNTLTLKNGKRLRLLDGNRVVTHGMTSMKRLYEDARWNCQDVGGRLPTKRELNSINRAGTYRGGVTVSKSGRENYYWALKNSEVYISHSSRASKTYSLNSSQVLNYVCIE